MVFFLFLLFQTPAAPCADAADCRARAEAAALAGDFEVFHDLAWRAFQKGKPNDPEAMALLARAQALSGRLGDALVMLGRLTDLGRATDAATKDDFKFVRVLPGWPALEARLTGKPAPQHLSTSSGTFSTFSTAAPRAP